MKKLIFFLLFFGITAFTITQASAGCNIVWSGYVYVDFSTDIVVNNSAPTSETSKTEEAAKELYSLLGEANDLVCNLPNPGFINDCYGGVYQAYIGCRPVLCPMCSRCEKKVCINGVWSFGGYWSGSCSGDGYYSEEGSGTWDVICDNTTTTIIPATTTTAPPTVIELSSFTAAPKAGKISLQWSTESEINNAGFNLYRAESENGQYIKINPSIISAQGSSTQGAAYEFTDANVQNRKTYYYKLEDIDLSGTSTMHGPVSAMPRLIYGMKK
jgi:hypothetical protein